MKQIINGKELVMGTCYYPEHWDASLWEKDMARMLECGIKVVRVAEFAWNKIEPEEGAFTFDFFDSFLDIAVKAGMKVIFCTPTATPPAWLTSRYPEALNADMDGNLYRHGSRRHYNYNSPKYQELCRKIVEMSASHYGPHPAVIGWQIDNELNCEIDVFYSESDTIAFREYLKNKYGSLNGLNEAWGTVFWNETYTHWDQVHLPRKTVNNGINPHLHLDYIRFISDSACRFTKMQADILRKYCKKDDFITTNGMFSNLDYQRLTEESLDFITFDSYPNFSYCGSGYHPEDPLKDRWSSKSLSQVRAVSPVFGIMEQQSGANGWNTYAGAPTPRPGQITLWTMESIAHGADFISYFRWRTCTVGTEIYWHGILDYSGRDNRRLAEIKDIHQKMESMQELSGSLYEAKVAVLQDYDNIWDAKVDKWHQLVEQVSQNGIFQAAQLSHTPLDYISLDHIMSDGQLAKYQVLFYPHASILTKEGIAILEKYVEKGGILVMGCRTGYKDIQGRCIMDFLPGLAGRLTGTDIPEYTLTAPDTQPVMVDWGGEEIEAAAFNDLLSPVGDYAEVLGTYSNSDYKGTPALICNSYGKGKAYYFGGAFPAGTARTFLKNLGVMNPYEKWIQVPQSCETAVRTKGRDKYLFLLNYTSQDATLNLYIEMKHLFTGETHSGEIVLPAYGCTVYKFTV